MPGGGHISHGQLSHHAFSKCKSFLGYSQFKTLAALSDLWPFAEQTFISPRTLHTLIARIWIEFWLEQKIVVFFYMWVLMWEKTAKRTG